MRKIAIVLLCILLVTATFACSPTQQPQKTYEEQKELYNDIISQYTSLLTAKHKGEVLPLPEAEGMNAEETEIATALYGIVDACKNAEAAERMGYGYKDFDNNGTPELILLSKYNSIRAIFTISNDTPILLEANYGNIGESFEFAPKNRFFWARSIVNNMIEEATFYTCHVDGDKIIYDVIFGAVYDQEKKEVIERYQEVDGTRTPIDENTYNELYREREPLNQPNYTVIPKLAAPLIHFPLLPDVNEEGLPVADFSSYDKIIKTYSAISTCLDEFDSFSWFMGEYDHLFSFPDDISYDYYNRLLYSAYNGSYNVGYDDEIDLNKDGIDELVLLNEDYRIKAIFTQKKGVPVLLDAFAYETCWLDDQGFIHVDNESYYELEYNLYEFKSSGEYGLVYSILAAKNGNRYLTKDGKTEQISFEKSLELYYDDYCRYSEPFTPNEQTRNISSLKHTPINDVNDYDLVGAATAKNWYKNAELEKTTGKDLARGNTYISFENVTDKEIKVNIKYEFIYSYPDPDRDYYLLNDITESYISILGNIDDNVLTFNEGGIKGRIEFAQNRIWLIIEESTDSRFHVGNHCYNEYIPEEW